MLTRVSGKNGNTTEKLRRKRRRHRKALYKQHGDTTQKGKKHSKNIAICGATVFGLFFTSIGRLWGLNSRFYLSKGCFTRHTHIIHKKQPICMIIKIRYLKTKSILKNDFNPILFDIFSP
jgi:hypothetical protein